MQNKRQQESDLVTKTKYFNDSKTKGRPGVCSNNLTQLHSLLNHFSKQNALQRYFIRGDDDICISYPIFLLCLQEGLKQFFVFSRVLNQLQAPQLVRPAPTLEPYTFVSYLHHLAIRHSSQTAQWL